MLKKLFQIFFVLVIIAGFSCKNQSIQSNPIQTYNSDDPIARALGIITQPYPSHGQFDVGVVFERLTTYFDANTTAYAGMAFDTNGIPAKADSAVVNGHSLIWKDFYLPGMPLNVFGDTIGSGANDSISFHYVNFNGESYSGSAGIASPFKNLIFPDTISESQGFQISYSDSLPNDSLVVIIKFSNSTADSVSPTVTDTMPDNGLIIVKVQSLPQSPYVSRLDVYLHRKKIVTQKSPIGERIGIYSTMSELCIAIAKP